MATTNDPSTVASLLLAASDPANEKARAKVAEIYGSLIREGCRHKRLQPADQENVAQAVLCKLFDKVLRKYDPDKEFRHLLTTLIHHAIADLFRDRQRRPGAYGSGDPRVLVQLHEAAAPDEHAIRDLAQEVTRRVAGQMERDQRRDAACKRVRGRVEPPTWDAFWRTTVEGEPVAAVAADLGKSVGAVYVAKCRVAKMIRSEAGEMA
jgi:RNA polymerase sigma factor (sigma-70 family)